MEAAEFYGALPKDDAGNPIGLCKKLRNLVDYPENLLDKWEASSCVPSLSFGPVGNDETIIRQVLDPLHWDSSQNTITNTLFEDAITHGSSVHRGNEPADIDFCIDAGRRRAADYNAKPVNDVKPRRSMIAFVELSVSEVRAVKRNEQQAFRVLDTADREDSKHADICQRLYDKKNSLANESIKAEIFALASKALFKLK